MRQGQRFESARRLSLVVDSQQKLRNARLRDLQQFTNENAYIRLGSWWVVFLSIITPVILIIITAFNIYNEFASPYEGYPASGLIVLGGGVAALTTVLGFIFQTLRWRRGREEVSR